MPHPATLRKPEIMSPAGYWPQLHAAVEAGADAVYFGLKHFTARAKVGFSLDELPEVMRTLHRRGVRGFVTFNTLIFEHELPEAARVLRAIVNAGADALIVQDIGSLRLARKLAPDVEIHGSTQMSITDAHGVHLAARLGVNRVTLARELSLDEIRAIRAATNTELEIFVHGALCVAYSGQCFSSEAWGGRSANRGQCAQACRLPYDLIVDGRREPLGDARYLLSPGDLYALHHIPEIVRIGISTLKIEGRYKDADYVALTTRAYRRAVDAALEGQAPPLTRQEELQLEQVYSRGLGPWFISGVDHQVVVKGRSPRHRGVLMGTVVRVAENSIEIEPSEVDEIAPLKPGDGVVFDAAAWRSPQESEEGGRVYSVARKAGKLQVGFAIGSLDARNIRPADLLWRTHDPDIDKAVRPLLATSAPVQTQRVHVSAKATEGEPLRTEWRLIERPEVSVQVNTQGCLENAQNRVLSEEMLREQLGRLGNTPYQLAGLDLEIAGAPFAPVSLLNQIRREAVAELQKRQEHPPSIEVADAESTLDSLRPEPRALRRLSPQLHLLVRNGEQLEAALAAEPASITLDYLDLYGLKPSVERVKSAGIEARVASPRVLKPGEERIVDFLLRLDCPILVRSAGLLEALRGRSHAPLTGDFSLNTANSITADTFLGLGLERIAPTHDLNAAQVANLARQLGGAYIEAIAYGHLPVFHTEHCVFCRFLSSGKDYRDCGRPCEKHVVSIRDLSGRSHPVIADVGCRNTVFGAEAQEASAYLAEWRDAGVVHYRLEFAHESRRETAQVTKAFHDALQGRRSFRSLAEELKRIAPQGTTEGSLYVPKDYAVLPVLQ